jgi:hypothetical protein
MSTAQKLDSNHDATAHKMAGAGEYQRGFSEGHRIGYDLGQGQEARRKTTASCEHEHLAAELVTDTGPTDYELRRDALRLAVIERVDARTADTDAEILQRAEWFRRQLICGWTSS